MKKIDDGLEKDPVIAEPWFQKCCQGGRNVWCLKAVHMKLRIGKFTPLKLNENSRDCSPAPPYFHNAKAIIMVCRVLLGQQQPPVLPQLNIDVFKLRNYNFETHNKADNCCT